MDTQTKGDLAELRVAAAIRKLGYTVLLPFTESQQYDLVAEAMIALTNRLDLYEGDTVTDVTAKKADANHFGRVVVTFNE